MLSESLKFALSLDPEPESALAVLDESIVQKIEVRKSLESGRLVGKVIVSRLPSLFFAGFVLRVLLSAPLRLDL